MYCRQLNVAMMTLTSPRTSGAALAESLSMGTFVLRPAADPADRESVLAVGFSGDRGHRRDFDARTRKGFLEICLELFATGRPFGSACDHVEHDSMHLVLHDLHLLDAGKLG